MLHDQTAAVLLTIPDTEPLAIDESEPDTVGPDPIACAPSEEIGRLWAAAPDLLAACEAFIADWARPLDPVVGLKILGSTVDGIRAALAKAEGKP